MRIDGLQNKFELFQAFYYQVKGVEISYHDAVRLFYNMDEDTQIDFAQYCADRVEYEIIDTPYITGPSGYGFDKPIVVGDQPVGERASKTRKSRQGGKRGEYVWSTNRSDYTIPLIKQKYAADAFAAKNGLTLDDVWSQFSAEEIMKMYNDGISIPQEIVDAAETELQTKTGNLDGTEGESEEGEGNDSDKTEKETFLELIPKAKKHIDKCHDKEEKIDEKVTQLVQDNGGIQKSFEAKMKKQKDALKEYEQMIREWRVLQNKINNGEELTDTEARKYAQITGMLEDKNGSAADFKLDKLSIARNLNEINILAVLGEQLADETIEIGDQLADYVSETNYKSTRSQVTGEMGFLRAIIAMLNGKTLAKEANEVGHETKDYTEDTTDSIKDIAGLLGVEKMIVNPAVQPEGEKSADVENTENKVETEGTDAKEELPATEDGTATSEAAENENETVEEDFIVNDENVLALIDEASKINSDLVKQINKAVSDAKVAKDDQVFAETALKIVTQIIENYKKEEEVRQQEITAKEEENQKAQEKIEELGGGEDENEEIVKVATPKGVADQTENENQKEIDAQQAIIDQNNIDIEALNEESSAAKEEVTNTTSVYKERIEKSLPDETKALENDSQYKDEIIPEDKERLAFTLSNGKTLFKMGTYRVEVGLEQIARWQFKKGYRNITKGTNTQGIGVKAVLYSSTSIPKVAEKTTGEAVETEENAIESLTNLDNTIIEVTEEKAADGSSAKEDEDDESKNDEEGADGSEDGAEGDASAANASPAANAAPATGKAPVAHMSVAKTTKKAPKTREEIIKNAKEADKDENKEDVVSTEQLPKRGKKDKNEGITDTDKAGEAVKEIGKDGKDTAKDSEKVNKDTLKDEKKLDREAKKLQKKMKKDEKDIIKMTKESIRAAKKQEEILKRYEELIQENDAIAEEEANKKSNAPAQVQQGAQVQGVQQNGMQGVTNSFGMTDSSKSSSTDNAKKMEANNQEITVLSGQFTVQGKKIQRNRKKIIKLQKATKKDVKKVEKKTKIKNQKIKEAEKKEIEKQKKLAKQLATVGIAENIFSITIAIGEIMAMIPYTAAAGAVLIDIGTYGVITCGLTKAIINFANGNTTAALIGLAQTAITAVGACGGAGAGGSSVLKAVSAGLSVASNSAQLVNNVRTVQGRETSDTASKIGTIAGVASAITSSANSLGNMKGASGLSKAATIASAVGTVVSSTGQLMQEFGGDGKTAELLNTIGGGISMAASVAQMAASKKNMDSKNKENTDEVKQNADNQKNNEQTKKTSKEPDAMPNQAKSDTSSTPDIGPQVDKTANATAEENKPASTTTFGNTETSLLTTSATSDANIASESTTNRLEATEVKNDAKKDDLGSKNDSTTSDVEADTDENLNVEKTRAQKKQERKEAKKAIKEQKEKVKNDPNLSNAEKRNMLEDGATKDYANIDDEDLQEMAEYYLGEGVDTDKGNAYYDELEKRGTYKKQKQMVEEHREQKQKTITSIMDAAGKATSATASAMSLFGSKEDASTGKKQRNKGSYDSRYLKADKYMATSSSNDNYFGGDHNDDQKRRFKKFAKRI